MSDRKLWELRTRLERAANGLARGTGWTGEGMRRAITVTAAWWAWLDAREGAGRLA